MQRIHLNSHHIHIFDSDIEGPLVWMEGEKRKINRFRPEQLIELANQSDVQFNKYVHICFHHLWSFTTFFIMVFPTLSDLWIKYIICKRHRLAIRNADIIEIYILNKNKWAEYNSQKWVFWRSDFFLNR